MQTILTRIAVTCLLAVAATTCLAAGPAPGEVGSLFHEAAGGGALDASSERIASPSVVRTFRGFAVVRLDNGEVLRLDPGSSARFEAEPSGSVAVRVYSGRVSLLGESGRLLRAGAGSRISVMPTAADPELAITRLVADQPGARATARDLDRRERRARAGARRGSVQVEVDDDR